MVFIVSLGQKGYEFLTGGVILLLRPDGVHTIGKLLRLLIIWLRALHPQ